MIATSHVQRLPVRNFEHVESSFWVFEFGNYALRFLSFPGVSERLGRLGGI